MPRAKILKSKVKKIKTFGECLRVAREKAGLSQKELAAKLKMPSQNINRYENGTTEPRISFVLNVALVLNISLDELLDFHIDNEKAEQFEQKRSEAMLSDLKGIIKKYGGD